MIRRLISLPVISLAGLESVSGRCRAVQSSTASARTVAAVVRLIGSRNVVDIGTGHGHTLHAACAAMRGGSAVAVDLPPGDGRREMPDGDLATVASSVGHTFALARSDADDYDIIHVPLQVVVVDSADSVEIPILRAVEADASAILIPSLSRIGRRERSMDALADSGYWAAVADDADTLVAVRWAARWLRGRKL